MRRLLSTALVLVLAAAYYRFLSMDTRRDFWLFGQPIQHSFVPLSSGAASASPTSCRRARSTARTNGGAQTVSFECSHEELTRQSSRRARRLSPLAHNAVFSSLGLSPSYSFALCADAPNQWHVNAS